ncbi:hypothetical protein H4S08_003185 [Coemansia sp. RSA 1365]|nr:hypothetical protein H4S08_003185 [Coemansia sp. RSA 1365]
MPVFTVVTTSGHAITVRPSPSDTLQSIVVSVCKQISNSTNPEDYMLQYNKKTLSLPTPIRLANLPQGARLQLCLVKTKATGSVQKADASVKVALQIVGAGRIINEFAISSTLWDILLKAETDSGGTLNITTRRCQPEKLAANDMPKNITGFMKNMYSGAKYGQQSASGDGEKSNTLQSTPANDVVAYQQPILLLLNKEFSTNDVLQSTTFRSLGFTGGGNVMIRLSFKDTQIDTAEFQKMADASLCASAQKPAIPVDIGKIEEEQSQPLEPKKSKDTNKAEINTMPLHSEQLVANNAESNQHNKTSSSLDTQQIRVFDNSATTPSAQQFSSLDTSEVSSDDAKLLLSIQRTRQAESERGFKSRLAQEAEEKKRKEQFNQSHPKTIIRFRFPDQVQIQATFLSTDCVSKIYVFIADVLVDATVLCMLVLQPAQDLAAWKSKTLRDAGLSPAAVVHVKLNGDSKNRPSTLELLTPEVSALAQPLQLPAETNTSLENDSIPVGNGSPASIATMQMPLLQNSDSPAPNDNNRAASAPQVASDSATKNRNTLRMPKWFYAGQRKH